MKPLQAKDYVSDVGQLNLSRLSDDALEKLAFIRCNGVGLQRHRSVGVVFRSFVRVLVVAGYSEPEARANWCDQILSLDSLNANSEE